MISQYHPYLYEQNCGYSTFTIYKNGIEHFKIIDWSERRIVRMYYTDGKQIEKTERDNWDNDIVVCTYPYQLCTVEYCIWNVNIAKEHSTSDYKWLSMNAIDIAI